MLRAEAEWIGRTLAALPNGAFPLLNLASSDEDFRRRKQPWIHEKVFAPIESRGLQVIHVDARSEAGVDVVVDLSDPDQVRRLKDLPFVSILCSNLLEHLTDPVVGAQVLLDLTDPGQLIVVSGPMTFPPHPDPIDNGFRGGPEQIAALFGDEVQLIRAAVITDRRMAQLWAEESPHGMLSIAAGMVRPWRDPTAWHTMAAWGSRRARAAAVILERS